jgi:hypothetical protein
MVLSEIVCIIVSTVITLVHDFTQELPVVHLAVVAIAVVVLVRTKQVLRTSRVLHRPYRSLETKFAV